MTWAQIKALLDRLAKGETLSEAELKSIKDFQEPKPDKTKEAELQAEVDRLKTEKEEAEAKGLPELDQFKRDNAKLTAKIAAAEKERDDAKSAAAALQYDNAVAAIAGEHKFADRDFLKFKLQSGKIDVNDTDAVKSYMDQLKKDAPQHFEATVNNGGAGSGGGEGGNDGSKDKSRLDELLKKETLSMSEASEVATIQEKINNPKQGE